MNKFSEQYYVGIGASAGGLEAIESFFKYMPSDTGMIFIVIQHLSNSTKEQPFNISWQADTGGTEQ